MTSDLWPHHLSDAEFHCDISVRSDPASSGKTLRLMFGVELSPCVRKVRFQCLLQFFHRVRPLRRRVTSSCLNEAPPPQTWIPEVDWARRPRSPGLRPDSGSSSSSSSVALHSGSSSPMAATATVISKASPASPLRPEDSTSRRHRCRCRPHRWRASRWSNRSLRSTCWRYSLIQQRASLSWRREHGKTFRSEQSTKLTLL